MSKYDIIFEELQNKVDSGELTVEDAQVLNDVAYEKYSEDDTEYEEVTESSEDDDEGVTYEEYLEAMEEELFGEATRLAKEIHKKNNELDKQVQKLVKEKNQLKFRSPEWLEKDLQATQASFDRHDMDFIDSIKYGRKASKLKNRTYKINGKYNKNQQKTKFDTEPSEKSLENRPAGRFIKKK